MGKIEDSWSTLFFKNWSIQIVKLFSMWNLKNPIKIQCDIMRVACDCILSSYFDMIMSWQLKLIHESQNLPYSKTDRNDPFFMLWYKYALTIEINSWKPKVTIFQSW